MYLWGIYIYFIVQVWQAGIFSNWKRYKRLIIPVALSETEALKYPPFQDIFYFDEIF